MIDPATLLILNDRLLREGIGEVVKHGVILDAALFEDAVIKSTIIAEDEHEADKQILLNYGHTIGHALETLSGYGTLLHGEAVYLGVMVEVRIAQALGLVGEDVVARQDALVLACGGPLQIPEGLDAQAYFNCNTIIQEDAERACPLGFAKRSWAGKYL